MKQDEIKSKPNESEKDIIYSKTLKAGKRIYYLDVKKNLRDDLFVVITESKRNYSENHANVTYEKHKIFLYREDFEKFMNGMDDVIRFISNSADGVRNVPESVENEKAEDNNL